MTKPMKKDENGQLAYRAFHHERIVGRTLDEMLGLLKGVICDGELRDSEVVAFRQWLQANPDVAATWPGRDLAARVVQIFEDGVIDPEEREQLFAMMKATVGEPDDQDTSANLSSTLPLTQPAPTVVFDSKAFIFTGRCVYGTRARCEQAVAARGGKIATSVGWADYLVIGYYGSDQWLHSTHGTKDSRRSSIPREWPSHRVDL
jgi:hypothetical protein